MFSEVVLFARKDVGRAGDPSRLDPVNPRLSGLILEVRLPAAARLFAANNSVLGLGQPGTPWLYFKRVLIPDLEEMAIRGAVSPRLLSGLGGVHLSDLGDFNFQS